MMKALPIMLRISAAVAVSGAEAHAGPARDCSKPAIRKQRADADKAVAAKDYARAIGVLEPVVRDCSAAPAADRAWLASDLAVAYDKAGRYLDCQRILAPLSHPSSGLSDSGKLAKAIEHNLDHCSKGLDARYAALKPGGCTLAIDHAIAAAVAPAAVVPKGATAACVALLPGVPAPKGPDDDPDVPNVACPVATLVWKGARPALERQALSLTAGTAGTAGTGALGDDSVCCNLSVIAAGTLDGKPLIRVRGQGRDCNGGTADSASDAIYEWVGAALKPAVDASVSYH